MTRAEQLSELWQQGHTDTSMAQVLGVSRQAVQQYHAHHPEVFGERPWDSGQGAAKRYGVSHTATLKWARAGLVRISPGGRLYLPDIERIIGARLGRLCGYPGCDKAVGRLKSRDRFCPEHIVEVKRYRYPVDALDPERLARVKAAQARWVERNPERAREIIRRANREHARRVREGRQQEARPQVPRQAKAS